MSVLIKDMKMPKCCLECPFEDLPEFDSYCIAIGNEFIGEWEGLGMYKPDWCPLEESKTGEWIPCSERLPSNDGCVLVTIDDAIEFGKHEDGEWSIWVCEHWDKWDANGVTAWMPLPEPYKGGESDD